VRCSSTIHVLNQHQVASSRTAAAAVGALLLYWPAILLPILEVERLGHREHSSVLAGTIELLSAGSWFVGTVVLLFSLIFPLVKILLLLELSWLGLFRRHHRATTYRIIEHAGKWSMMDVMLLTFMVMLVKLGDLVQFRFGPGVVAFVLCVAMSMLASISFDPHAIWEDQSQSESPNAVGEETTNA
jgi:paraquat-inducible protein A